ncbi:ABC transporter related protein [Saccharopolyspora spinosa]|uniref:ABC transporter related protein n=1 Tax=Saccharopolyspora spinosa TaxID=60894 RepID=UPI000237B313|nr:ABC transporter related protein [Saccharopolyspora spinosa]
MVNRLARRVAVMHQGKLVEQGDREVLGDPQHDYTNRLLAAAVRDDPVRQRETTRVLGPLPDRRETAPGPSARARCVV